MARRHKWRTVHIDGEEWRYKLKHGGGTAAYIHILSPTGVGFAVDISQVVGALHDLNSGYHSTSAKPSQIKEYIVESIIFKCPWPFKVGDFVYSDDAPDRQLRIARTFAPHEPYALVQAVTETPYVFNGSIIHFGAGSIRMIAKSTLTHANPLMALASCADDFLEDDNE